MKIITTIEVSADCTLDQLKNYDLSEEELKSVFRDAFLHFMWFAGWCGTKCTVDVHVTEG